MGTINAVNDTRNTKSTQSFMDRACITLLNFFGEETLVCRREDGSIDVHYYGIQGAYAMSTSEFSDAQSAINFCEKQFSVAS